MKPLKLYIHELTQTVDKKNELKLPDKVSLVFDGWSEGYTHYVAVFETLPRNQRDDIGYGMVLLTFSHLEEEDDMDAEGYKDFIEWVLSISREPITSDVAIIGHN